LLYFIFGCIFLSKIQKNSSFIVVIFTCLYNFARMGTPENTKLCDFTSTNNNDFIYTPIVPPSPEVNFYEIKPALFNLVMKEQFLDVSTDDAAAHLNNFVGLCEMQKYKDVDGDIIKLKLFPFSLRGRAKDWLLSVFWILGYPGPPATGPCHRPIFSPGENQRPRLWRRPSQGGAS
jgi:hypothetical protein